MPLLNRIELWDRSKGGKIAGNGYWVLWPLVFLVLFQPSPHRLMAAIPLSVLAIARERKAQWAWRGEAFWVALLLSGVAMIGAEPLDLSWVLYGGAGAWFAAHSYALVLPVLGGAGVIAILFAAIRERGLLVEAQQDRIGVSGRGRRALVAKSAPAIPQAVSDRRALLVLQMETSARFKAVSDRRDELLTAGDVVAADLLAGDYDQARRDYEDARAAFLAARDAG